MLGLHSEPLFSVQARVVCEPNGTQHVSRQVETVPQSQISPSSITPLPQIAQNRCPKHPLSSSRPFASIIMIQKTQRRRKF